MTIFTQGAWARPSRSGSTYHSIHERLEFTHSEYGQAEYGARLMADEIVDAWKDIGRGDARGRADPDRFVPFTTDFPVQMTDQLVPGPGLAPVPGRVELPHRPAARRRPADPGRRPARLQQPAGVSTTRDVLGGQPGEPSSRRSTRA